MLRAVLGALEHRADLVNAVIEVRIAGEEIVVETYTMPPV